MRRSFSIFTHALAAGVAIAAAMALGAGRLRENTHQQPDAMGDMQAEMAKYMKSIQPGDKHKVLERFVGDWDTTTRMFMAPGMPPIENKGACSYQLILGNRFVRSDHRGHFQMPGPDGKPIDLAHDGVHTLGFDNNRKLFTMSWVDTMSTGILTARGGLSQDGSTLTMFGEMDEPMTGEMGKAVRYVTRFVDDDTMIFEISEVLYGDPFKVVEVEYRRRKHEGR